MLDAGVGLGLVVPLAYSSACTARFHDWLANDTRCVVPTLWQYEVVSSLRKLQVMGQLSAKQQSDALDLLLQLGVEVVPPSPSLHRSALSWAMRLKQTVAYDGAYVALAEELGAPLWTADGRLANAAQQAGLTWVKLITT